MSATLDRAAAVHGITPARARELVQLTLVSRLLDVHANLADARAVARTSGLTRCAEDLTQQIARVSGSIKDIVSDLTLRVDTRVTQEPR